MQTTSGEEVSTGELKNMLKKLVDDEDKKKPLTDDELVILMEKAGYQIARRTVAKYRQMLDIPGFEDMEDAESALTVFAAFRVQIGQWQARVLPIGGYRSKFR